VDDIAKNGTGGRVALVDDEASIRETVALALERAGFRVETYADGLEAWNAFESRLPDVAILDILMPRLDGLDLCRRLRGRSESLPILFLTSKDEEFDRVLGLELGADDYLVKPFSVRELVARVRVLFRRLALTRNPADARDGGGARVVTAGSLTLDPDRHEARWGGEPLHLTVTEFRVLQSLARHPGHVKTRDQLLEEAYPDDAYVAERTVDSHIKRLRRKLEDAEERREDGGRGGRAEEPFDPIETVYGLGYRFRES
jgi:two-component system response regulator ChvI